LTVHPVLDSNRISLTEVTEDSERKPADILCVLCDLCESYRGSGD
jgi:hypothetical protein